MNLVATMFATQHICNATWAAHSLRSDQNEYTCYSWLMFTIEYKYAPHKLDSVKVHSVNSVNSFADLLEVWALDWIADCRCL